MKIPGHMSLEGVKQQAVGLLISNSKTAKKGKPQLAFVEDPVAMKLLEVIMTSNYKHPRTANLFENTNYVSYKKQIQLAARYYGLQKNRITPHGSRLGKEVENYNHRVDLKDITLDGRWASSDSAIEYIKNGQVSLAKISFSTYTQNELRRESELYTKIVERKWSKMKTESDTNSIKKKEQGNTQPAT